MLSSLPDQLAFSNPESDVIWRVSRFPQWSPSYWNWTIQQFWISMSPQCLPSSFGAIWLTIRKEMWFEEFQDDGHLGYWNRRILAILNLNNTPMLPIQVSAQSDLPSCKPVSVGRPGDASYTKPSPHPTIPHGQETTMAYADLEQSSRRANKWRSSRCLLWRPSWISEQNCFSNSESPCRPNSSKSQLNHLSFGCRWV